MDAKTVELAMQLRDLLARHDQRIVLAESCTSGRIASTLGGLPGISSYLCGGFVVYRNDSKAQWLGIAHAVLDDPAVGPVSMQVTEQLAAAAIERTPEATIGLAITGDIGPGAPAKTDGTVFCALCDRNGQRASKTIHLSAPAPMNAQDIAGRARRLDEAVLYALQFATEFLQ